MAQTGTMRAPTAGGDAFSRLTEKEIHEIEQYGKIVRFRDAVLSGKHPTIKLPPGLKALAESLPVQPKSAHTSTSVKNSLSKNQHAGLKNPKGVHVEADAHGGTAAPTTPHPTHGPLTCGRTEINPILLEKSDELIRAEFQLQRQRLERALKDDIEQRRASKQPESLVVVDLSDVLTKALTLVEATATPSPADKDLTANHEAASDSFDDDTFYSSHHHTPESNLTSRIRDQSERAQVHPGARQSQQPSPVQIAVTERNHPPSPLRGNLAKDLLHPAPARAPAALPPQQGPPPKIPDSRSNAVVVPGLNNYIGAAGTSARQGLVAPEEPRQSVDLGIREGEPHIALHEDVSLAGLLPPSPLIRSDDNLLSTVPYTTQLPSLAAEKEPMVLATSVVDTLVGTPAQVVALRREPIIVTSSDTSSPGERDQERKRGRRKRRKVDRQAPETEVDIYIKPEPRSPSPLAAPSFIRPHKRQKQSQVGTAEHDLMEPQSALRPMATNPYDPHRAQFYKQGQVPTPYEEPIAYPRRVVSSAVMGEPRYGRDYMDEYPIPGSAYIRRAPSPNGPSYQYSPREAHPSRAVAQLVVNDPYRDPPAPPAFRESLDASRMSVRPDGGESFMVPPRPPPTRIIVDAYGREYIEPPHPAARHSVAPSVRHGEAEILYERVPPRAMSRNPGSAPYGDGVMYARPPPSYGVARHYVTQTEYLPHEYRDSRAREYSTQPGPEFIRIMSPQDARPVEERPREYISRAAHVGPSEAVRYEAPHEYGRMHSVRPEVPAREHRGSVHPESRRGEGASGYMGEYGGVPMPQHPHQQQQQQQQQQPYMRREYSVRPTEHHNGPPYGGQRAEEMAFIEGPRRRTQEVVYVDDGRREAYRP